MRRPRTQHTPAPQTPLSSPASALAGPVCPRCLGINPGEPGGDPFHPYTGPLATEFCKACAGATINAERAELGLDPLPQDDMRIEEYTAAQTEQVGREGWRGLVAWPDDERLTRRHIQAWAWQLNAASYVLLRPALGPDGKSTRVAVVAETLKGTAPRIPPCPRDMDTAEEAKAHPDPVNVYGDDLLTTRMRVHWFERDENGNVGSNSHVEEADVPNALALRYVTGAALFKWFLAKPITDEMWDYTREHPDAPFVCQPGPPRLVADITTPLKAEPPRKRTIVFHYDDET